MEINKNCGSEQGISRREFTESFAAVVAATLFKLTASFGAGISVSVLKEEVIDRADLNNSIRIIKDRLGIEEVELVIGDHIPPPVDLTKTILSGEVSLNNLRMNPADYVGNDEASKWYGGLEITGGDRIRQVSHSVASSRAVIAIDGSIFPTEDFLVEYKNAVESGNISAFSEAFLAYLGISLPGVYANYLFSRRDLLAYACVAIASYTGASMIRNNRNYEVDLSRLPKVDQDLNRILPMSEKAHIRTMSWVNSLNSFQNINLNALSSRLLIYGGSGHKEIYHLIAEDEETLNHRLEEIMITKIRQFSDCYESYQEMGDKLLVSSFTLEFCKMFPPVTARINGMDRSLDVGFNVKNGRKIINSSSLTLCDALNLLLHESKVEGKGESFYFALTEGYRAFIKDIQKLSSEDNMGYKIELPRSRGDDELKNFGLGQLRVNRGHLIGVIA